MPRQDNENRAALLAWWLAEGQALTRNDVTHLAKKFGVQPRAVSALLDRISVSVPIVRVNGGTWKNERYVCERDISDDG
jgi:hypothetical protein